MGGLDYGQHSDDWPNPRAGNLFRKVVVATPVPQHVPGGTMESAAKGVGIAKGCRDDVHAELVDLLHLTMLARFHADRLVIQYQAIHR